MPGPIRIERPTRSRPYSLRRKAGAETRGFPGLSEAYGVLRGEGRLARSRVKGARCARTSLRARGRQASPLTHSLREAGSFSQATFGPRKGFTLSYQHFDARQVITALTGLDFGLRVRVDVRPAQRTIFSGAEKLTVQALTAELAEMVAGLRVYSYPVRGQLEQVVSALQINVTSGSWAFARRAALDLATVLTVARNRRLVDASPAKRGANAALRVADLCEAAVR